MSRERGTVPITLILVAFIATMVFSFSINSFMKIYNPFKKPDINIAQTVYNGEKPVPIKNETAAEIKTGKQSDANQNIPKSASHEPQKTSSVGPISAQQPPAKTSGSSNEGPQKVGSVDVFSGGISNAPLQVG